ncbi:MAG: endo-1,4-beta-xylanase [Oscillospiraceae bacterium]|nr:endo-1,4-beta-xylanase [Oscillospiraceae bacterium]
MQLRKMHAILTSVLVTASMLAFMPGGTVTRSEALIVSDNFDIDYDGWTNSGDLTIVQADTNVSFGGTRSMHVLNRQTSLDGACSEKSFYIDAGRSYDYSVYVYHEQEGKETFSLSMTYLCKDEKTYQTKVIETCSAAPGEWTKMSSGFKAPKGASELTLKITTDSTCDFYFDDFNIRGKETVSTGVVSAAGTGLKDRFANYYRVGSVLNGNTVKQSTITANILKEFNSITFENELKPDATMNKSASSGTNIGVSLSSAASILNFCSDNGIGVRGHTLVWHSQTPQWVFKENFNDSGNWVSSSVMDQRMESYIKNMFSALKQQYPDLDLYAYDVCNECVSDDSNRTANNGGARVPGYNDGKSPYVQIYGNNSFVEKAFTYARKYAPETCSLFYNDYNEYWDHKRDCIYNMCKNLYNKGLLDGVGMQSHINADSNGFSGTSAYTTAMKKYASIGCQVQVTELDISTEGGKFSLQQQAQKYKDVFQAAIDINKSGGRVTAVCVWGPNDANTWIKSENAPLLFDSNNQAKPAFTALQNLVPQSEWGDGDKFSAGTVKPVEPDANGYWFHDTFEDGTNGWTARGGCTAATGSSAYKGSKALSVSDRTDAWNGGQKSLNSRMFEAGKEYSFSACFMNESGADQTEYKLTLQYTDASGETSYDGIDQKTANKGDYVQLYNPNYKIPAGASDLVLVVETTEELCDFNVDEIIGAVAGTKIDGPAGIQVTSIRGDLDFDSKITVADFVLLKSGIISGFTSKAQEKNADIDQSTVVDVADAVALQKYLLGMITEFPIAPKPVTTMRTISEYTPTVKISEFETADSKQEKAGVAYGTVKSGSYYSTTCKRNKPYNILLPANYSTSKKYPVLYVMHGYYENQDRMIIKGNGTMYTRQIIGNAIADGSAEDMIVVFPYIYSSATQADCSGMDDANNAAYDNFINDLTKDLMPHIEKTYSVKTGRENTAITGFSMGGRESLLIGMQRPDLFGYVGAICPAPGVTGSFKWNSEEEAPSLVLITAGSNDTVVYSNPETYHNNFTKNGVPHIYHYVNGGYHGDNSIHAHLYNFVRAVFKA